MGYYGGTSSGDSGGGHTHANKAVLDQITDSGSGQIITDAERQKIGAYTGNDADSWNGSVPATTDEAIARIARVLTQHLGTTIPPLDQ